jgi:hypothetical protein
LFRIAVFNQIQCGNRLQGSVLIAWRLTEIENQFPPGRGETQPPVVPAAVGLLIVNYSLYPSPPNLLWEPGSQNKCCPLNIDINYGHIEIQVPPYPFTEMLEQLIKELI